MWFKKKKNKTECDECLCIDCQYQPTCGYCPGCKNCNNCKKENCIYYLEDV